MKSYKLLLVLSALLFLINSTKAQQIGQWNILKSYHNATKNIPAGNKIYVLSSGSLFTYDNEDKSVTTYDKSNILNDDSIADICYNTQLKTLVIVYSNSNIDLLNDNDEIYNIPDFMNKTISGKKLNNLYLKDEYVYLSTDFGIVILNLKKKEITNSYSLNKQVKATTIKDNIIYAATGEGIFTGKISDNLLDNSNWKKLTAEPFDNLFLYDNSILGFTYNTISKLNPSDGSVSKLMDGNFSFANISNDKLIIGNENSIFIFNGNPQSYIQVKQNENFKFVSYGKNGDMYWGSNGSKGLMGYKLNKENNKLENTVQSIIPDSPVRNLFEYTKFEDGYLLVAGGGINLDRFGNPGTIMTYKEGTWSSYQEEGIFEQTGLEYKDITSVAIDPRDKSRSFASSAGEGVYEFKDGKFVRLYGENNSTLKSIFPGNPRVVRVNGLLFDKNNNLWVLNSSVENIVNVLKNDNKWITLNYPEISKKALVKQIMFDSRGWGWICVSTWKNPGLFCFDMNGTLENTADDKTKFFSNFTNQDGTQLGERSIFCIVEDKNGTIWIGTAHGPLIINNPTKVFDNNFYFTQIKVPRNDGTNNADFLLDKEKINTICIDGANRKWIGTESGGAYLISEDGLETIHHFTMDNSPIPSNNIMSISIDPNTGIVYLGTEKGLAVYRSDATEGGESFSDEAHVFPNPVKPDYDGLITVTGLVKDSEVKITDSNGNLIYTGTSLGGQFSWNGKNRSGKRAASGVYFVLATNKEGKEGIVTKILMIK